MLLRPKEVQAVAVSDKPIGTTRKYLMVGLTCVALPAVMLMSLDASATGVDILKGPLTALPADALKIYGGLVGLVPFGIAAAAGLAAARGGMGYVVGLMRSVISAG